MTIQDLIDFLHSGFLFLEKIILCIPRYAFKMLIDYSADAIDWVYSLFPDLNFQQTIDNLQTYGYFLSIIHADWGMASILSAYSVRFMIRRIPVIG